MSAGLYVHVPFCVTRCGYCDFNAYSGLGHLADRYVDALQREAGLNRANWSDVEFGSVFFGGGTPTTLESSQLISLLEAFGETLAIEPDAEVTVEANPDTVDEHKLDALRGGGVTRLSIGAQSFDEGVLLSLERVHSPESVRRAFGAARAAGWDDVNLDLIYGTEGETLESWRRTLTEAIDLDPEHVSAYALTIEAGTPLGREVASGHRPVPDGDLQADMFELACELLGAAGYEHYEISNWARPGRECVHNLGYWEGMPYLGIGAGAHSYRDGRRWWNIRPPAAYLESVESKRLPLGGEERLDAEQRRMERVSLGLRTIHGLPSAEIDPDKAIPFLDEHLLSRRNGHLVLTERGMLLANEIVLALA